MKYQVLAALFAVVSAKKESPDCPESTQVFSYTEHVPAAAGFTQIGAGFATGMNGDEDLGEDITMKGDKFHYVQKDVAQVQLDAGEPYVRPYDTKGYGPNGGAEKVSVPDPRIAHTHTTFYDKRNKLWRFDSAALVQVRGDNHETEKTHVLEPIANQEHAERNWGLKRSGRGARTTFY